MEIEITMGVESLSKGSLDKAAKNASIGLVCLSKAQKCLKRRDTWRFLYREYSFISLWEVLVRVVLLGLPRTFFSIIASL
jgi:hypothetical protein